MTSTNGSHPAHGAHPLQDPRLVALGRELERATRRLTTVEALTGQLDLMLRQLAADVTLLVPIPDETDDASPPVRSWLAGDDPAQASADLVDLIDWIDAVYRRYPGGTLPSCWLWHPAVVEELWWLRHTHHGAYHGPDACWRDVADWHDRHRPGVTRRITAALGDCELSRHLPAGDRHHAAAPVPLAAAAAQVAEHWTTHRHTPTPTQQQLTEADQHDRAHLRTRR